MHIDTQPESPLSAAMSGEPRGQRRRARSVPHEDEPEAQYQLQTPHSRSTSKIYSSPSYATSLASPSHTSAEFDEDDASYAGLTDDDEETGLTTEEQKERRQRRRQAYRTQDVGATTRQAAKGGLSIADLDVLKKSGINAVLIGLWYLFSVSISVVRAPSSKPDCVHRLNGSPRSIINGCSRRRNSTFNSHFSRPPCICWFSSRCLRLFYYSCRASGLVLEDLIRMIERILE